VRVRFTPSAKAQFLSVIRHILEDDPLAARRFRQRAEKVLKRLQRFPLSGRTIPEFPDLPQREVLCPPYRFFYRVEKKTIWVIAVWHSAQIPEVP